MGLTNQNKLIDELLMLFDSSIEGLPDSVNTEMRADVNNLTQKLKGMVDDNYRALQNETKMVHSSEEVRIQSEYLLNKFNAKYGTKGNK
jgi:hypothetical protein